jgi:hypothetical protein
MSKLKVKPYFEQVSVEDELPNIGEQVFVVSDRENNIPMRLIRYFGGDIDEKELKRIGTHFLKPTSGILLTEEELIELFGDAFNSNYASSVFSKGEIFVGFLKSKGLINSKPNQE